ncbi:MAG: hypothetical protein ACOX4D_04355 [Bacteroidales bacterium]|jgi:V/A-type H+-transporting ATPase subunit E
MEDTLKKLTEKIYQEGVDKANEEANKIISNANNKANEIIENAQKQANKIISKAENEAIEYKNKITAELEITTNQSIAAIKQTLSEELLSKLVDVPVNEAFKDKDFIKDMINTILSKWDLNSPNIDLDILYPNNEQLDNYIKKSFSDLAQENIKFYPSDDLDNGFVFNSNTDGYKIDFTEESFTSFIKDYIRPRTFELLFKKEK